MDHLFSFFHFAYSEFAMKSENGLPFAGLNFVKTENPRSLQSLCSVCVAGG